MPTGVYNTIDSSETIRGMYTVRENGNEDPLYVGSKEDVARYCDVSVTTIYRRVHSTCTYNDKRFKIETCTLEEFKKKNEINTKGLIYKESVKNNKLFGTPIVKPTTEKNKEIYKKRDYIQRIHAVNRYKDASSVRFTPL